MTATALALRDYQHEALDAIAAAHARGVQRPLVALPTGTGKTVIFAHQIQQRPGRALVLAHRDELIAQAVQKIRAVAPDAPIGVVKAERDEHDAPIVVASVQTLSRPRRLARLADDFDTVVVDEAHHANADSYVRVLEHVGSFAAGGPLTVGFTATPERADGQPLGEVWEQIVFQRDILGMIEDGYLADLRAVQVRLAVDFGRFHTRAGDFIASEVDDALALANAPQHALDAYQDHAAGRTALVFTPSVAAAHTMAATFRDAGIRAEALDGTTPADERHAILERLQSGETPVVCNCGVLTEGFDCPSVSCIVVARPTKSRPLYIQMIGRGTRLYPGKDDCLVIDLVGATTRHDLLTAAALFGLHPDAIAEQTVTEAIAERAARQQAARAQAQTQGQLVAQVVDLFRRRRLHWVRAASGRYTLTLGDGQLVLDPDPSHTTWRVIEVQRGHPPAIIATGLSLGFAQGRAEDIARERGAGALVNPAAGWRQRPASEKQIALLRRRRIPHLPDLTAGQASDLIAASFARVAVPA